MVKYKANHVFELIKEKKTVQAGDEIDLTVKRVEEIHENLSKNSKWKHIVPVFERVED
nr:hypothetical protein [Macrococcus goetzii]